MNITGYKIREQLRQLSLRIKTLQATYKESLFVFLNESTEDNDPRLIAAKISTLERQTTALQEVQAKYNLGVKVAVGGGLMSLLHAIKLIGGAGRLESMWRTAATSTGRSRWGDPLTERDADKDYAQRRIPVEEALTLASEASKRASEVRTAIAVGNAREVEMDVDPALFS
jgi:hypothetical protein